MATSNQQLTDYQRLPLLSAALFAGIVTLLAGLAFAADHYAKPSFISSSRLGAPSGFPCSLPLRAGR